MMFTYYICIYIYTQLLNEKVTNIEGSIKWTNYLVCFLAKQGVPFKGCNENKLTINELLYEVTMF